MFGAHVHLATMSLQHASGHASRAMITLHPHHVHKHPALTAGVRVGMRNKPLELIKQPPNHCKHCKRDGGRCLLVDREEVDAYVLCHMPTQQPGRMSYSDKNKTIIRNRDGTRFATAAGCFDSFPEALSSVPGWAFSPTPWWDTSGYVGQRKTFVAETLSLAHEVNTLQSLFTLFYYYFSYTSFGKNSMINDSALSQLRWTLESICCAHDELQPMEGPLESDDVYIWHFMFLNEPGGPDAHMHQCRFNWRCQGPLPKTLSMVATDYLTGLLDRSDLLLRRFHAYVQTFPVPRVMFPRYPADMPHEQRDLKKFESFITRTRSSRRYRLSERAVQRQMHRCRIIEEELMARVYMPGAPMQVLMMQYDMSDRDFHA